MPRKVLVLGGTDFVGPAVVGAALARGYEVTIFHRGQTGSAPDVVQVIHGDRTNAADLDALTGESWDMVVDAWSRAPRVVLESARKLEPHAARYVYISTISVYAEAHEGVITEASQTVDARPDADATDYAADKRYTRNDKGESSGGPNAEIMHTIAARLTAQDIRNLASYVQGMR